MQKYGQHIKKKTFLIDKWKRQALPGRHLEAKAIVWAAGGNSKKAVSCRTRRPVENHEKTTYRREKDCLKLVQLIELEFFDQFYQLIPILLVIGIT